MRLAVICTLALAPAAAQAGQIWFGGMDPVTTADRERVGQDPPGTYAANDFMNLFRPNAPWTRAASTIQVFQVSTQFLHRSTDEQLSTVINDLRRRHIALAVTAEIMQASQCSHGIPGFSGIDVWRTVVDRVGRLGAKIDYVEFDGPVAFAHYNIMQKDTACKYTIEELVRNIAPQIQVIKTAFPDAKFGDGEPVNGLTIGKMDDNCSSPRNSLGRPVRVCHSWMQISSGMKKRFGRNWRNGEGGFMRRGSHMKLTSTAVPAVTRPTFSGPNTQLNDMGWSQMTRR